MPRFRISLSKTAERVDYDHLNDLEKRALCRGILYDSSVHDIYRFFVAPEFVIGKEGKKRIRRRKSYARVDTVLVQARVPSTHIQLLGVHPISRLRADGDGPGARFTIPIVGNMKIRGSAKDAVRQGRHAIIAYRTDEMAQWVFLKPYIESEDDFRMKILCTVAQDLDQQQRFLRCNVSFQAKGREIEGIYRRRVEFPTKGDDSSDGKV